jgi:hypothetical protein
MELVEVSSEGYWHPDELDVCRFLLFWDMVQDIGRSFLQGRPISDVPLQSASQR